MSDECIVEAALFCAGRPIQAREIAESLDMEADRVEKSLRKLMEIYGERRGAIEVVRVGRKYVMQLKEEYAQKVSMMADPTIPRDLLKTAALIAYHQPVLQSKLLKMVGGKVYEHVRELREMNLIDVRPRGRSLELSTSKTFPDYFGINATNREEIKKWLQERVQSSR